MQTPLYSKVYEDLKGKISSGEIKVGEQIPTEKDLTDIYHVSRITVQKAVNLLADDGIVDRRSGVGTFVIDAKNPKLPKQFIGLILPGITDSYGTTLLKSLIAECERENYQLVLKFSEESQHKESQLVDELVNMPVNGLIIEPVQRNFYDSNLIQQIYAGFPIVILDKEIEGIDSLFVGSDHYNGALLSAEKVLSEGHRNIVLVGYQDIKNSTLEKRFTAFQTAFSENGATLTSNNMARVIKTNYQTRDQAALKADVNAIKAFLQGKHPTCVVAVDTHAAGLAKQALADLGLRVPEDISLFGFDTDDSAYLDANYTYLQQDEVQIGKKCVQLLTKAIRQEPIKERHWLIPASIEDLGTVRQVAAE